MSNQQKKKHTGDTQGHNSHLQGGEVNADFNSAGYFIKIKSY